MLHYKTIPVTPFQQNCSLVWDDATMTAAVIDPGGDLDRLRHAAQTLKVTITQIWLTHAHTDPLARRRRQRDAGQLQLAGAPLPGPHSRPRGVPFARPEARLRGRCAVCRQHRANDFPQGDHDTLITSITGRLWPMGDDTVFIPGHGPESTFGRERRSNPYVCGT